MYKFEFSFSMEWVCFKDLEAVKTISTSKPLSQLVVLIEGNVCTSDNTSR